MWSYLSSSVNKLLRPRGHQGNGAGATALASKALSVPLLREAMPVLRIELARARRYEHPLSVLLLTELDEARSDAELRWRERSIPGERTIVLGRGAPQFTALLAAAMVRDLIRKTDHIAYAAERNRLVLALPETDRDRARRALLRIGEEVRARVKVTFRAGIAVFPDDGFTFRDLLEQASRGSTHRLLELHGNGDGAGTRAPEREP